MSQSYFAVFAQLMLTPFQHLELVWGIVPVYFALLLSELTSAKKSFRTAIQTGFSFLWAGAQWIYLTASDTQPIAPEYSPDPVADSASPPALFDPPSPSHP